MQARHVFFRSSHFVFHLSVPSMVDLGEIRLHIGVNYGKERHASKAATRFFRRVIRPLILHSVSTSDVCVSPPPPDDSRENYRESICQTMRLLLRE